jgi:DNA-binding NarL/FixJ family response regulator
MGNRSMEVREAAVKALGWDEPQIAVALVGGRRFREQCLARFLEQSGVEIRICAVENLREDLLRPDSGIDVAILDTGEHTCKDPGIRTILACIDDALPSLPIVVVSDREGLPAALDALNGGARAYFPSSLDPSILLEALRVVQKGGTFTPFEMLSGVSVHHKRRQRDAVSSSEMYGLTPSEHGVLELLKTGQSNKFIARELDIEESTVKVHVRRIMRKLNAANRTQVALVAQRMADADPRADVVD